MLALWIILGIVGFLIVVFVLYIVSTYNKLIRLKNNVEESFSAMDVSMKKRYDLVPNLVETVKGYAKHENKTLEDVIKARNSFVNAKTDEEEMSLSGELTKAVGRLFALTESYPELKADQNFMSLQNDLRDSEDKISTMRQFYNDTVLSYNNKVEMIPSNIVAKFGGFKKGTFFETTGVDREVPKVSF